MRRPGLVAAALLLIAAEVVAGSSPRVAIIIDDLGYELDAGRRAIGLPGPVSYAILPATPGSRALAETAYRSGKEVLLHLPLQAANHDGAEDPGMITLDMSRQGFRAAFRTALRSVPFAIGVSSHRGSLLTRHPGHMTWLMQEIAGYPDMVFVDSYTTPASVALQIAQETGVPAIRRDVFLDHDPAAESVRREFERLKALAMRQGAAVGIGHPYATTLTLLERELPGLAAAGIELVTISDLFASAEPLRRAQSPALPASLSSR